MASAGSADLPAAATWSRLQTFLAVYETGSVRAAAELLHVTPPAVSAAIAALESALGTALFGKAGRGIVPTDSGETFASYVRKILGLLTEAAGAVREAERGRLQDRHGRDSERVRPAAAHRLLRRTAPARRAVVVRSAP